VSESNKLKVAAHLLHERIGKLLQKGCLDLADAPLLRNTLRQQAEKLRRAGHFDTALMLRQDESAIGLRQLAWNDEPQSNDDDNDREPVGNDDDTEIEYE
jgi:hypothetical protein